MTNTFTTHGHERWIKVNPFGFLGLSLLLLAMDKWSPGSGATTFVRYTYYAGVSIWLGLMIRTGYRRRKPYWTRKSWQRYLRLMAMPVGALIVMLTITYFLDPSQSTFGAPRSAMRSAWAALLVALMLFGAVGLVIAIDWMGRGEPAEQFTRRRFFRRRGSSPIAD